MDEKMFALLGAAAGVTLGGRALRPVAKVAVRGVVMAADATTGALREVADIYSEVKAEQRASRAGADATPPPPPAV